MRAQQGEARGSSRPRTPAELPPWRSNSRPASATWSHLSASESNFESVGMHGGIDAGFTPYDAAGGAMPTSPGAAYEHRRRATPPGWGSRVPGGVSSSCSDVLLGAGTFSAEGVPPRWPASAAREPAAAAGLDPAAPPHSFPGGAPAWRQHEAHSPGVSSPHGVSMRPAREGAALPHGAVQPRRASSEAPARKGSADPSRRRRRPTTPNHIDVQVYPVPGQLRATLPHDRVMAGSAVGLDLDEKVHTPEDLFEISGYAISRRVIILSRKLLRRTRSPRSRRPPRRLARRTRSRSRSRRRR